MIYGDEPAMPCVDTLDNGERYEPIHTGLTIRQQFAMTAMQGLCANIEWAKIANNDWDDHLMRISNGSVEIADQLIKALNETPNPNEP